MTGTLSVTLGTTMTMAVVGTLPVASVLALTDDMVVPVPMALSGGMAVACATTTDAKRTAAIYSAKVVPCKQPIPRCGG